MAEFILLMHSDVTTVTSDEQWDAYLIALSNSGALQGGSAMGDGACFRRSGEIPAIADHLGGYLKVEAGSLEEAARFLAGNPVYENGGTVEIRELPKETG